MENSDWYSPNLSTTDQPSLNATLEPPDVTKTSSPSNCTLPTPDLLGMGFTFEEAVITGILCALYLVFGVVCAFFGYRCFKAVMYVSGFIFASVVVYLVRLKNNEECMAS